MFAVGREVPGRRAPVIHHAALRPTDGLKEAEGIAFGGIAHRHDSLVRSGEEEFLPVWGPYRKLATTRRDLPLATWSGEWPHIDFEGSGFLGLVGYPSTTG